MSQPSPAAKPPRSNLKKVLLVGGVVGVVVFVVLQLVPTKWDKIIGVNPPERYKLEAPAEVEAILRRACMDCHSNETRWPFYSRIAPGSWLMARDVGKGRARFNMSEWGDAEEADRALDKESSWEQIEEGEMPPWFYIPLHPDAKLSDAEKATLKAWLVPGKPAEKAAKP
jgi:cytochrome c551/c552